MEILNCEYCKTSFNSKSNLLKHQRITKYCLILQGKMENIEKAKKEYMENRFRCEYCKIKFAAKNNLCGHLEICLEKYKKIIDEKEKEKEKLIEEKEKLIKELKVKVPLVKMDLVSKTPPMSVVNVVSIEVGHTDSCSKDAYPVTPMINTIYTEEQHLEDTLFDMDLEKMNNKLEKETPHNVLSTPIGPVEERSTLKGLASSKPNKPLVLNDIIIEVDPVSLMINATQMCKAAGKKWNNYFKIDGTKDYLQALESNAHIRALELIKVDVGGNHSGTFVHRLVAVHLAQWLSPSFAVQVSLWVSELMITGKVEIGNELSSEAIDDKWRLKLMEENNRCKDLELKINRIEEDKIKKEEYDKKKIIDELNTTISVFSTETKSNLNLHEEKEVIYLGYIGNFLFKYGQSSNFKDRLCNHEKSTSYEKFEIVKVFACKNPVVSEKKVREWVRKNKLEYEYKPDGEKNQREIIKIESKEMLERVTKTMQKYSNLNINKNTDLYKSEAVEIKRIEANKEVELKRIEADADIKRMNLLSDGKITFDQYIQLRDLK